MLPWLAVALYAVAMAGILAGRTRREHRQAGAREVASLVREWARGCLSVVPGVLGLWWVLTRNELVALGAALVLLGLASLLAPRPQRRGARSHVTAQGEPKVAYANKAEAATAAKEASARYGEAMSAYRCASCPGWHIGHRRPVRRR